MGERAIDKNTNRQIESKKKVFAKYFLVLLTDLKWSHNKQIPWGGLYGELFKSYKVIEFA